MLPTLKDWISNPQQALTAYDTFSVAAEAITQPLVAYEKELTGIRSDRANLRFSVAGLFGTLALTCAAYFIEPQYTAETLLGAGGAAAHMMMTRRGIRSRSASTLTLRTLHPSHANSFAVMEEIFSVRPKPNPRDVDLAIKRAQDMREYALRLGVQL